MAGRSAIAGSESSVLGSNERSTAMTEVGRMSVGELVGKVLADEHTDVLCQAVVWLAQELMEAEVTQAAGASYGERSGDRVTRRTATGSGPGTPGSGRSSWPSPSCGKARTSRASWSRVAALSRPWSPSSRRLSGPRWKFVGGH